MKQQSIYSRLYITIYCSNCTTVQFCLKCRNGFFVIPPPTHRPVCMPTYRKWWRTTIWCVIWMPAKQWAMPRRSALTRLERWLPTEWRLFRATLQVFGKCSFSIQVSHLIRHFTIVRCQNFEHPWFRLVWNVKCKLLYFCFTHIVIVCSPTEARVYI